MSGPNTVVTIKAGSHLYGTTTPQSDTDYVSVYMPTAHDILLQKVRATIEPEGKREKAEGERNKPTDVDNKYFSLQKFLEMASDGQTLALDMLFAPDENILFASGWWEVLRANRHRLLSRKNAAYLGYCRQQANKYGLKGSRVVAANVAANSFEGLVEYGKGNTQVGLWKGSLEQLVLEHPDHMAIVEQAAGSSGELGLFFECCSRKVAFNSPVRMAAEIYRKVSDGYGDRAKQAQVNEGVDWKALSHAVRVGMEAIELLTTGHVTFPRPEAAHLLDIKLGKLPYKEVSEEIEFLLQMVEDSAAASTLPDEPDHEFVKALVHNAYRDVVMRDNGIVYKDINDPLLYRP